ncbi:MAG: 5-formyltetrahydrofolate cyclo-ligase [Chlamydiae bacterium]|nr:5-formyltetrahydrofolate cyclo-ligase [Chlamydiota bacterium]
MNKTADQKKKLRVKFKHACSILSSNRKKEASESSFTFLMVNLPENSRVLSFASLEDEINIWDINFLLAKQNRLYLPRVVDQGLQVFQVHEVKDLMQSSYGILEPNPECCKHIPFEDIDVILVPGIAFDKEYHRLGRGEGLYDQLLSEIKKIHPSVFIWGIGYEEQFSSITIPTEVHDQGVDQLFLF